MAAEASEFWKDVQDNTEVEASFGGALTYVGAEIGGKTAGFIARGQDSLWGLLE
jgi:hypothetical protein